MVTTPEWVKKRKISCDPFKSHENLVTKGLRPIHGNTIKTHHSLHFDDEDQLCTSCRKRVSALPQEIELSQFEQSQEEDEYQCGPSGATPGTSTTVGDVDLYGDWYVLQCPRLQ